MSKEKRCTNLADFMFSWPGQSPSFICNEHVPKLRAVANAMGFSITITQLSKADKDMGIKCSQITGEEKEK